MPQKNIEILARGVCVRRNRLLVCRTGRAPIVYLPGGHVEFGETVRTALKREIQEELNCSATIGRFLGAVQHTFIQKGRRHWEINLVFAMQVRGLSMIHAPRSSEKHLTFEWVKIRALKEACLEPAALWRRLPGWLKARDDKRWVEP